MNLDVYFLLFYFFWETRGKQGSRRRITTQASVETAGSPRQARGADMVEGEEDAQDTRLSLAFL